MPTPTHRGWTVCALMAGFALTGCAAPDEITFTDGEGLGTELDDCRCHIPEGNGQSGSIATITCELGGAEGISSLSWDIPLDQHTAGTVGMSAYGENMILGFREGTGKVGALGPPNRPSDVVSTVYRTLDGIEVSWIEGEVCDATGSCAVGTLHVPAGRAKGAGGCADDFLTLQEILGPP